MKQHEVLVVGHPRVLGMQLMAALDFFETANRWLVEEGREPFYRVQLASLEGGGLQTWSGVDLAGIKCLSNHRGRLDSLVLVGGYHAHEAAEDPEFVAAVRRVADRSERVVGLCTAAFILAAAGLLDGKRATTHWLFGELLASRHPSTVVDTAPIFICDGRTWTSAGNVAGFDLLLALIGQDLGAEAVRYAARTLVVFLNRPGNQAQFSAQPFAATSDRRPIRELQQFIADHPRADLSLARLAARVGLSPRHLTRVFQAEVGDSPGRYVESVRLETARRCLDDSELNLEAIATAAGFGSMETMRRVFHHRLSVSPSEYRRIFGSARRRRPRMLAG